jgi:hypothetical protein
MNGESSAILDPERSAALREKLLIEVGNIPSADLAAGWARKALAAKNSLIAIDARLVEDAFEQKVSELQSSEPAVPSTDISSGIEAVGPQKIVAVDGSDLVQAKGIDKSVLAVAAPRRYRNREHLRSVAKQPCLICGRKPSDPHHLRYVQPRALGRKASDEFTVPLCRVHHRAIHRARDERAWWQEVGIDPVKVARKLWQDTRIEEGRMEPDPTPQAAAPDQISKPGGDTEPQPPA